MIQMGFLLGIIANESKARISRCLQLARFSKRLSFSFRRHDNRKHQTNQKKTRSRQHSWSNTKRAKHYWQTIRCRNSSKTRDGNRNAYSRCTNRGREQFIGIEPLENSRTTAEEGIQAKSSNNDESRSGRE